MKQEKKTNNKDNRALFLNKVMEYKKVIAIVLIVLLLAFLVPKLYNVFRLQNLGISAYTEDKIITAGKEYYSLHYTEFRVDKKDQYCIPIKELTSEGILDSNIKDQKGNPISLTSSIIIKTKKDDSVSISYSKASCK